MVLGVQATGYAAKLGPKIRSGSLKHNLTPHEGGRRQVHPLAFKPPLARIDQLQ